MQYQNVLWSVEDLKVWKGPITYRSSSGLEMLTLSKTEPWEVRPLASPLVVGSATTHRIGHR